MDALFRGLHFLIFILSLVLTGETLERSLPNFFTHTDGKKFASFNLSAYWLKYIRVRDIVASVQAIQGGGLSNLYFLVIHLEKEPRL